MNAKKNRPSIKDKNNSNPNFDDIDMLSDPYYLDPQLKAELKESGLIGRFVNIKRMEQFGGRHQKGWRPYKRESQATDKFSQSPDGLIYRGNDLVLAVKTVEEVDRHKKHLRYEADQVRAHKLMKSNKERLKQELRGAAGIKVIDKECHD